MSLNQKWLILIGSLIVIFFGIHYYKKTSFVRYYKDACRLNDSSACNELGHMYEMGIDVFQMKMMRWSIMENLVTWKMD